MNEDAENQFSCVISADVEPIVLKSSTHEYSVSVRDAVLIAMHGDRESSGACLDALADLVVRNIQSNQKP